MTSSEIRKKFLEFFANKQHHIANAAPLVIKNDPTLMFTNAGMNQFKELFLGNQSAVYPRIVDTQPCLRVSGKHNDLEDVGKDTYHHTLFEMLGNWSFGDYFKKEAILWAWELLTDVYNIPKDRIYVTVFGGDASDKLSSDEEARTLWKSVIDPNRIIDGSKKDNFWEMGDTGPCGPCTEIHIDLRPDSERNSVDGKTLVNNDHPQVIEVWNVVFMEFNRMANGSLISLPAKHVDTGMGFERLCMALQGKTSNYDTDVFKPLLDNLESICGKKYGENEKTDIAFRVIVDHIRAVTFIIADGQLPSNNKAGYVARRILRRAVRYGYTYLGLENPFLYRLVSVLSKQFAEVFPHIEKQENFIVRIILEEEQSFLRTLSFGLKKMDSTMDQLRKANTLIIPGEVAFELFDTFGFPYDLINLIASENGFSVDENGYKEALLVQKTRSRADSAVEAGDWVNVSDDNEPVKFVGYDILETTVEIQRYRKVKAKGKEVFHLVFTPTPFYAESGGQVGDKGIIKSENEVIKVLDTLKENNLIIHVTDTLPVSLSDSFIAIVEKDSRVRTQKNHSATHLMHAALRQVLGTHVEQKGSFVSPDQLRFDFSHFSKITDEEMIEIEQIVNVKIREGIALNEQREVPIEEAKALGAMALFGEKYGDTVRMITFDENFSRELCGGTHVKNTQEIGYFKLVSEGSISSGIRRIEALSGESAFDFVSLELQGLKEVRETLKASKNLSTTIQRLLDDNQRLSKELEQLHQQNLSLLIPGLKSKFNSINGMNLLVEKVDVNSADHLKKLSSELRKVTENAVVVLASNIEGKVAVLIQCDEELAKAKGINAAQLIKSNSSLIQGGGGGQAFLATAGGTNVTGIDAFLSAVSQTFKNIA